VNAKILSAAVLTLAFSHAARGTQNLDSEFRKNGETVVAAFEEERSVLQHSSAVIRDGRKDIAYGAVVSSDGYILTKASEIQKVTALTVLVDTQSYEGHIVATDPTWDVALVKIEAEGLQPVVYADSGEIAQGTWVVANGATSLTRRRALPGIISARSREIPASGGAALGIILKEKSKELEIDQVNEKSGAQQAGLQSGDVILSVDGNKVSKLPELSAMLKDKKAGTTVKVTFRRQGKEQTVEVRLLARGEMFDEKSRNDQMSGEYSLRRTGFPKVIQHDILGSKASVGGPLLDLDGRCVGMNIARADRAQSFAIPADDMKALAERLMKDAK